LAFDFALDAKTLDPYLSSLLLCPAEPAFSLLF
jgi:hypothetical protein